MSKRLVQSTSTRQIPSMSYPLTLGTDPNQEEMDVETKILINDGLNHGDLRFISDNIIADEYTRSVIMYISSEATNKANELTAAGKQLELALQREKERALARSDQAIADGWEYELKINAHIWTTDEVFVISKDSVDDILLSEGKKYALSLLEALKEMMVRLPAIRARLNQLSVGAAARLVAA